MLPHGWMLLLLLLLLPCGVEALLHNHRGLQMVMMVFVVACFSSFLVAKSCWTDDEEASSELTMRAKIDPTPFKPITTAKGSSPVPQQRSALPKKRNK